MKGCWREKHESQLKRDKKIREEVSTEMEDRRIKEKAKKSNTAEWHQHEHKQSVTIIKESKVQS